MNIEITLLMDVDQAKALSEMLLMGDRTMRRLRDTSLTDTVRNHWEACRIAGDYVDTKVQAAIKEHEGR